MNVLYHCIYCGAEIAADECTKCMLCGSCGRIQNLPKNLSRKGRTELYARADRLRRRGLFDRARRVYETVLKEEPDDCDAYWALMLCEYGVDYVKDPRDGQHIPTINRIKYESIFENADYQRAVSLAEPERRAVYERDGVQLEQIRLDAIAISQKEKPYDVFISYKETSADGQQTRDSALAWAIYSHLSREGVRVFFSHVSLEDKHGENYEPYIFSALQSARVMIVVATTPEHVNAVWVKNEWSRYLRLMEQDKHKYLIPAYEGISPYELPEEFSALMGQDMAKVGAIYDLVHAVIKRLKETGWKDPSISPDYRFLLNRGYIFLADGEFGAAKQQADRVLDADPQNACAYLLRLCAGQKVRSKSELVDVDHPLNRKPEFRHAYEYGDVQMRIELDSIEREILQRSETRLTQAEPQLRTAMDVYWEKLETLEKQGAEIRKRFDYSERRLGKHQKKQGRSIFAKGIIGILKYVGTVFLWEIIVVIVQAIDCSERGYWGGEDLTILCVGMLMIVPVCMFVHKITKRRANSRGIVLENMFSRNQVAVEMHNKKTEEARRRFMEAQHDYQNYQEQALELADARKEYASFLGRIQKK